MVFAQSAGAQPEGGALGSLTFGGGAVAAAHLDRLQGATVLSAGVVGAGIDRALDTGVAGLLFIHGNNPPCLGWV